jgi:hypothetical protein
MALRETDNAETIMAIQLDQTSRTTVSRFVLKCNLSFAIALFTRVGVLAATSHCLQLYAVLTALIAVLSRQRYSARSFNHWSEALWLGFVAAGLQLLSRAAT